MVGTVGEGMLQNSRIIIIEDIAIKCNSKDAPKNILRNESCVGI